MPNDLQEGQVVAVAQVNINVAAAIVTDCLLAWLLFVRTTSFEPLDQQPCQSDKLVLIVQLTVVLNHVELFVHETDLANRLALRDEYVNGQVELELGLLLLQVGANVTVEKQTLPELDHFHFEPAQLHKRIPEPVAQIQWRRVDL